MRSNVVVLVNTRGEIVFGTNHDLKAIKNLPLDLQVRR